MSAGRNNKYDTVIAPELKNIRAWLENGATEKQVADNLGIARSTFWKWKAEKPELSNICKNARCALVIQLRGALVKKALGFTYIEKKRYKKTDEGGAVSQYVEETEKQALPDVAAINLALKNYDKENWANDPQLYELKKEELELKKQQIEKGEW